MANRPYIKHGIEQLQALAASSRGNLKALKVIQYELRFRNRPKARALKAEVDDIVRRLSPGASIPNTGPIPSQPLKIDTQEPPAVQHPPSTSARVIVECANCKTPNFVSTIDNVVQHLSCSACKSPYEAQFKYGVMRTTFQSKNSPESSRSTVKWVIIGLVVLSAIALLTK